MLCCNFLTDAGKSDDFLDDVAPKMKENTFLSYSFFRSDAAIFTAISCSTD